MDLLAFLSDHIFEILGWVSGIGLLYGLALVFESLFPDRDTEGDKKVVDPASAPARTQLDPPVYVD
jgi:hypothetical protein